MKINNSKYFTGLNENERKVLIAIRNAIVKETDNEFCYADEVNVENMSKHQIAGYLSQLSKKKRIYIDSYSFNQCYMVNNKGYIIDEIYNEEEWQW
jgi:hypothetical protein